jgi:hypothetical protein
MSNNNIQDNNQQSVIKFISILHIEIERLRADYLSAWCPWCYGSGAAVLVQGRRDAKSDNCDTTQKHSSSASFGSLVLSVKMRWGGEKMARPGWCRGGAAVEQATWGRARCGCGARPRAAGEDGGGSRERRGRSSRARRGRSITRGRAAVRVQGGAARLQGKTATLRENGAAR